MRRVFIYLLLFVTSFSSAAFAGSAKYKIHDMPVSHDMSVNLRVFVPPVFVGYFGGVWDIAISKNVSFGPILHVFIGGKYDGYDVGLNMNYALSGNLFKNGFILNPYLGYYNGNYKQPLDKFSSRPKVDTAFAGLNLLYQFIWKNGFNIMLGMGLEYASEEIPVNQIGNGDFHGRYELTIGYAF